MSWDTIGKSAKRMGITHPRNVKRVDPAPPAARPPGKSQPGKSPRKRFGFAIDMHWPPGWTTRWAREPWIQWFDTPRKRDQAMEAERKKIAASPHTAREITGPVERR